MTIRKIPPSGRGGKGGSSRRLAAVLIGAIGLALVAGLLFAPPPEQEDPGQMLLLASFSLREIPADMPQRDARAVADMRHSFTAIDGAIVGLRDEDEDVGVNTIWLKCVFYVRYFAQRQPTDTEIEAYVFGMTYGDGADWLNDAIKAAAGEILRTVNAALYSGSSNATHGRVYEMIREDPAPFRGADFAAPVENWHAFVTSEYGVRSNPTSAAREMHIHNGIDIAPPPETGICAAQGGTVVIAEGSEDGYGNFIVIYHGGQVATLYAHCAQLLVQAGDTVARGDPVATVGSTGNSTGPHLHFEVIEGDRPVNPRKYLP